jgi:hypothetical protein
MGAKRKLTLRVVGIQYKGDMAVYATEIEAAANELIKKGYVTRLERDLGGTLVMGVLQPPELRDMQDPHEHEAQDGLSPRTIELCHQFGKCVDEKDIAKHGPIGIKGFSMMELETAKTELAQAIKQHGHDCDLRDFWRAVLAAVKQSAQQNLQ